MPNKKSTLAFSPSYRMHSTTVTLTLILSFELKSLHTGCFCPGKYYTNLGFSTAFVVKLRDRTGRRDGRTKPVTWPIRMAT